MRDPSAIPDGRGGADGCRPRPLPLTPEERAEVEEELELIREQIREYAFPGRLHVDGERDDRARIRAVLERAKARTEALLS
jgi:hypothetical protein